MDLLQESATFSSITMDIDVVADMLLQKLYSVVHIARALNMHSHLRKLELFVRCYCHFNDQASEMVKLAFYQAENVIEEYEIFSLQKQLLFPSSKSSKVCGFFSCRLNSFACRIRMYLEIQKLIKKLDKIGKYRKAAGVEIAFECSTSACSASAGRVGLLGLTSYCSASACSTGVLTHRQAFVRCSDFVGRDTDDRQASVHCSDVVGRDTDDRQASVHCSDVVGRDTDDRQASVHCSDVVGRDTDDRQASVHCSDVVGRDTDDRQASVHCSDVVGRDTDRDIVVEMLLKSGNEATLFVFPIVGVGGIGKTTLAKFVYNDPRIVSHFQMLLWVHVSRVFKVEEVLEQIVNSVREDLCENLDMNELQNLVYETLYGKNYLIVLDDVWNEDPVKWDELKKSLMVGACGSKILVTTRKEEVASIMGTVPAYCLNSNQNDMISSALRVCYEQLPSNLKVCLAYCSIFPKGCVIEIDKLIQLWVAEGLISKSNESEDLEHIAIQYFQELLSRSFFQDVEEYRSVYTSICTMHDLVHDLALSAAGLQFCTVNSHIQNISDEVRHVAFSEYDLLGKELPASLLNNQALRTISFCVDGVGPMSAIFVENCIAIFMQLRVLDISDSCFDELPSSVGKLKYLRYLDVSANGNIKELPDSINKLLSLQTLRVSHCPQLEGLPNDIGNLISLRHLYVTTKQACFPDKAIGCLSSLRSLYIHSCNNLVSLSEGLQHLTSLRTLAIIGCPRLTFFPSAMKHLTALENLLIVDCEELTLLEWQDIEGLRMLRSLVIGGLPELESKDVHCLGSLQMLVLAGLPQLVTLPRWLEGASATLQYLRVEKCPNFAALPKWLENFTALKKIQISKCRKSFSLPEGMSCLTNLKVFRIDN